MASGQRPLSELSPVAQRRNSPSWNQTSKAIKNADSSPFDSSPFNTSSVSRLFWQGRDPASPYHINGENKSPYEGDSSISLSKRSSIENLKRASRVKNSSMFAREQKQEYDPTQVRILDRPLASGRPLSHQFQGNIKSGGATDARRQLPSQSSPEKLGIQSAATESSSIAAATAKSKDALSSATKEQASPTKSSLSKGSRFGPKTGTFDPENEIWSDDAKQHPDKASPDGHVLHQQAKSVTFDAAPPQINEYEMTTPVPSSVASSSREGSYDSDENDDESYDHSSYLGPEDSFDASLEDTDKTPVVLPDDWRSMSPASANNDLIEGGYDPFQSDYGSPGPDARPTPKRSPNGFQSRIESLDSNGDRRPLPPIPASTSENLSDSNGKLTATLERASTGHMFLPSPLKPASYSKAEINGIGGTSMPLEDRLRLMMVHDQESFSSEAEKQRERRMRRAGAKEKSLEREIESRLSNGSQAQSRQGEDHDHDTFSSSRISRDSILRDLKSRDINIDESHEFSSLLQSSSPNNRITLHPDIPIPSLESQDDVSDSISIKEEAEDDDDLYAIPDFYTHEINEDFPREDSELCPTLGDDEESRYSGESKRNEPEVASMSGDSDEGQSTPVPQNTLHKQTFLPETIHDRLSLSDFSSIVGNHFSLDLASHFDHPPPAAEPPSKSAPPLNMTAIRNSLLRPDTPPPPIKDAGPDYHDGEAVSTPESVIRHSVADATLAEESPCIPDPIATIKAPSGALKTRPSLTPIDVESMAAIRRKVSGQEAAMSPITEVPQSSELVDNASSMSFEEKQGSLCHEKRQSSLVKLDIPVSGSDEGLGFGLDREFDRVIETQKRGYLMRQNTKVIVASSHNDDNISASAIDPEADPRGTKSAGNSPRKPSQQTWTIEPWNGKTRRQSIKIAGAIPRKREPVPPLPGHESNVKDGPGTVDDSDANAGVQEFEDGEERGRLFVKVVGVKDLNLPLPRGERSYFSLTLDNGLHCVTTSWLELGLSAPIAQEFELVVMNELEFQLTLQMKLEEPKPKLQQSVAPSPTKTPKSQMTSTFSRVFASPKKRKELELKQKLEAEQLKQKAEEKALAASPWDKLRTLVAPDGSFARAYVSLGDYESNAFGRPLTVDATCFNEWATDQSTNSAKSKRSSANRPGSAPQRLPPYRIGNLELQLLYVPIPKGATDDDLPKSMNACIREMREAEHAATRSWDGFLSQQGGDCPYWRRRFFKLQGSKLTAYHEVTRQPRATINLAKASKLIDDKSTLTQRETSAKGGGRRKSAFAEEEEGYMFVEEGFRIRFGNGEVIDFYADSRAEKDGWMKVLSETVGKGYAAGSGQVKAWTELVLRRERSLTAKREAADRLLSKNGAPPPLPPKKGVTDMQMKQPPRSPQRPTHQYRASQPGIDKQEARRQKTRSLIF